MLQSYMRAADMHRRTTPARPRGHALEAPLETPFASNMTSLL